ncbi:MAG: anaerobic magnesium-protoporphyrin IX monomethyl ester cyclase elongator protein, partial [Parcubacteria group bacterium Athens0714_26]
MKILLINPPVFNDKGYCVSYSPPLGLLYLAAFLEKNGYPNIEVLDADLAGLTWEKLKNLFINEKPDIIGVGGTVMLMPALMRTIEVARQILPNSFIVAGGWGPSKEPEKVLRAYNKAVDCVVIGEGEMTLLELVRRIENKKRDFNDIDGLAFLDQDDKVAFTKSREVIMDLNTLPWPAWHLLKPDFSKYRGMHGQFEGMSRPVVTMFSARGCPHRCTFCSLGSKIWRYRNTKDVVDEMDFYRTKFGARSIQIYDDEFIGMSPMQNERVKGFCDEIIRRGLHKKLAFLVQGRCSQFINLDVLKKMREANFIWILWGVESGSQKVLDFIKKDIKIENVYRAFDLTKQVGIKSLMFIMVGFPKETPEDVKLTANLIEKIKPDQVRIHITTPHPGSELRKYMEEHNLIDVYDYYKADHR